MVWSSRSRMSATLSTTTTLPFPLKSPTEFTDLTIPSSLAHFSNSAISLTGVADNLGYILHGRRKTMLRTILIILLVLFLLGALPAWPYSAHWGYYPTGGVGLLLLVPQTSEGISNKAKRQE